MNIVTIWFGPDVPGQSWGSGLVLKKVVVAPDPDVALAAFAAQDGVGWADIVSVVPIDPAAPFTVIDS